MRAQVAGLAFASLACSASAQQVLWDQQWDGLSPAYMSQGVTDDTSQSTYLFDDVFPQESWLVNQVIIYGLDEGVGSATTAVHLRFSRLPSFTNPGAVPAYFDSVGANGLQGNQLTVGGTPVTALHLGLLCQQAGGFCQFGSIGTGRRAVNGTGEAEGPSREQRRTLTILGVGFGSRGPSAVSLANRLSTCRFESKASLSRSQRREYWSALPQWSCGGEDAQ